MRYAGTFVVALCTFIIATGACLQADPIAMGDISLRNSHVFRAVLVGMAASAAYVKGKLEEKP